MKSSIWKHGNMKEVFSLDFGATVAMIASALSLGLIFGFFGLHICVVCLGLCLVGLLIIQLPRFRY